MRELRELALDVARNRGALEMPEVIGARDEMVRRFVSSIAPVPEAGREVPPSRSGDGDDQVYWEPTHRRGRSPGPRYPNPLGDLIGDPPGPSPAPA